MSRSTLALAAVSMFCLLPAATHAGSGGTPTAPAAGKSTDYCCQTLTPQRQGTDEQGNEKKGFTFVNGTGCSAIAEDDFSRNACTGTAVKCRGEFFTPSAGTVQRCLTP
jgi:hypothetical protein